MKNKQERQKRCCDDGVCLDHTKDHQLFCAGRCHNVNCPSRASQESHKTVEEESHTQGWIDEINRLIRDFTKVGASKSFVRRELEVLIKEVERKAQDDTWKAVEGAREIGRREGFEAGRLQGIESVERWAFENGLTHKDCFKLLLTALEVIKNKK